MKIFYLLLALTISSINLFAQFDGTFESGNSISINGWMVANDYRNAWYVGAPGVNSGASGAYISGDNGATNSYLGQIAQYSHLYTQVNFPVGKTDIELAFNWKCQGQSTWNGLKVYLVPLSYNIQAGVQIGNFSSNPYGIIGSGADWTGIYAEQTTWQSETITLDSTLAGTSKYLVFSWENNNNYSPSQPPISIDNVVLTTNYSPMPVQTVVVGDTIQLSISGCTGIVQWQESNDSLTWIDMAGFTHSMEKFISTSSPTNKKYYRAKITDNDCLPHTPIYSNIIRHKIVSDYLQLQIGDNYQGGVIFNTDGSGNGLVAPSTNQHEEIIWGTNGTLTAAYSHWDGQANTNTILATETIRPIAASVCNDLDLANYSDWYLPAHDQLLQLYSNRNVVGGFVEDSYWWSSSVMGYSAVYTQEGESYGQSKANLFKTRCIRNFSSSLKIVYSSVYVVNEYNTVHLVLQPQSKTVCIGENIDFSISVTGTAPFTYQWYKNGNTIDGATNPSYTINNSQPADDGIYTCAASNTCRTIISNPAELKVILISTNAGIDTRICRGSNTTINLTTSSTHATESGAFLYTWTPVTGLSSNSISSPVANPVATTNYSVLVSDQLGCTASDSIIITVGVPFENEEICLVTIDEATGKNKITWEKTSDVGTEVYLIYKETGANDYSNIGNVNATQLGEFIDIFSNPQSYASRYKLVSVDTCGNESQQSNFHKTINLTISANQNTMGLQWNDYVEESNTFVPVWYYIYRGTSLSDMTIIDSISGGNGSYNDNNIFNVYYYKIGVQRNDGCFSSKSTTWAFSNPKENSSLVGISQQSFLMGTINISPNPMSNTATLNIPNLKLQNENCKLQILDVTGKVIRTESIISSISSNIGTELTSTKIEIHRGNLKSGIYFLELISDRIYRGKLIVE